MYIYNIWIFHLQVRNHLYSTHAKHSKTQDNGSPLFGDWGTCPKNIPSHRESAGYPQNRYQTWPYLKEATFSKAHHSGSLQRLVFGGKLSFLYLVSCHLSRLFGSQLREHRIILMPSDSPVRISQQKKSLQVRKFICLKIWKYVFFSGGSQLRI